MVKTRWVFPEPKNFFIKEGGVSATLSFKEGLEMEFEEEAWVVLQRKLSDALNTGKLIIISGLNSGKKKKEEK